MIYFRVLGLKSHTFSLKSFFFSFHIEHLTLKLRVAELSAIMLNQLEQLVHQFRCSEIFDSFILDRTLSFQCV